MKASLARRLMLAYSVAIAAVLISAWWSHQSLTRAEAAAQRLADRSIQAIELNGRLDLLLGEKSHLSTYLLSDADDEPFVARRRTGAFDAWIASMQGFVRTSEEHALLDKMHTDYDAYRADVDHVVELHRSGHPRDARRAFDLVSAAIDDLLSSGQQLFSIQRLSDRRAETDAYVARQRSFISWLTGLGALFSLVLGLVLSRYAARPVYQLALRIGASGVVDSVHVEGGDLDALEARVGALLERVRQQERALSQAEKLSELGELASELAHETLNPLAGVKGMLQALRRTDVPRPTLTSALGDMETHLNRVEGIVRRLMQYARPLEPRIETVAVGALVDAAARAARFAPGGRGRQITVEIDDGTRRLTWRLDPELMQHVLVNLIVNGCEASPPGAVVEVGATNDDTGLTFAVRDRGSGISPAVRARLFHPFFTTKPSGNGLGLAVSRNIVREHGGTIRVVAREGGGSAFFVAFPARGIACVQPS